MKFFNISLKKEQKIINKCMLFMLIIKKYNRQTNKWIIPKPIIKNILNQIKYDMRALYFVKKNALNLKFIDKQNKEICIEAVTRKIYALKYVKEQSHEICMEAIKQNGIALAFVRDQSYEICLAAVSQNGLALEFVKKQTPKIVLEAVIQNKDALQYIKY